MSPASPEILIVSQDAALAHAVTLAAPEEWTEWTESFSTALTAIRPETKLLVFDAALDGPLSRLLPRLFVDQRPGRRAIVIQPEGARSNSMFDARITVVASAVAQDVLADIIAAGSPAEHETAAA